MTAVELLQQIGLNKYEAEAYYALLSEGPLTGYELGKRSQVPLSRSYEILERLTQKGLALVQPGDPPRYTAQEPGQFLGHVRSTMAATLDALASTLSALPRADTSGEFWVLRGRQQVLARARALFAEARQTIYLSLPTNYDAEVGDVLALARARGCYVLRPPTIITSNAGAERILLQVDSRETLVGMLAPAERCQAVASANQALVAALQGYFVGQVPTRMPASIISTETVRQNDRLDWVAWEERKQRRLWSLNAGERSA